MDFEKYEFPVPCRIILLARVKKATLPVCLAPAVVRSAVPSFDAAIRLSLCSKSHNSGKNKPFA